MQIGGINMVCHDAREASGCVPRGAAVFPNPLFWSNRIPS